MIVAAAVCMLVLLTPAFSQECNGTRIGDLPTHYHKVRGELFVENEYTFCIRNFSYDGLGPDAFLYFYYPGDTNPFDNTGGGVIINITQPSGRPQFEVGTPFIDQPYYRFTLPTNRFRACDFGGFSIWCRYANQLFTTLAWDNAQIFNADGSSGRVACTASPGRGYVGSLSTNGGTVSGELYFVNNKSMAIRNFDYSSSESDVFVYWFPPGTQPTASGGGNTIMLNTSNGGFPTTPITGMSDYTITIPAGDVYSCDMGTFTIWCQSCTPQRFFTTLPINLEIFSNNQREVDYEPNRLLCNRTTTRRGLYINELPTNNPRLISGSFYVVDQDTFFIQLFSFDTTEYEDVFLSFFRTGDEVSNTGDGIGRINFTATMDKFGTGKSDSYYNQDLTIDLRLSTPPVRACDIGYFTVWSQKSNVVITKMRIPEAVFYSSSDESRLGAVMCKESGAQRVIATYSLAAVLVLLAYAFAL